MKFVAVASLVFCGLFSVVAQADEADQKPFPVAKNGSCPGGYYTSGNYCVPMKNTTRQAVPKVGSCPSGYITSGKYCK